MLSLFMRVLPYGLGFFLVTNAALLHSGGGILRITDLIAVALVPVLLIRKSATMVSMSVLSAAGAVVFLPMAWTGLSVLGVADRATLGQGVRWILAVPWALVLLSEAHREPGRTRFIKGLVVGCMFNVFVVVAQYLGIDGPLQRLGLSSFGPELIWVGSQLRMPGLHGAPSSSSAVISLIAPATLWLYLRDRVNILWPACGFGAAAIGLHLTSSRSPLLMILLSTGVAMLVTATRRRAAGLWAMSLGVGLPLLVVIGPPGGWVRWTDTSDALINVSDRLLSNVTALDLTLRHPLGMGVEAGRRALFIDTGMQATHSAWLQGALVFGLPLALAILVVFVIMISRLRYGWRSDAFWPALVAFHLAGLFLFEEHLNNPTFVILTVWLALEAAAGRRRTRTPRTVRDL